MCRHTEQTSLNLLFIAGASQRSPWWHINNSLQRDASLFSRSAEANEKHSCWLALPLLILPQPINDNHCFPLVHYDPGSSIKRDWNMHFLCAGGDVGFPEGGSSLSPPKSLSREGTHNKWQTRRPPLSLSLFTQSEKHSHCRPESVTRPNKSWRETQWCDCNAAGVFLPLFVLAGLHDGHRVVIMFNTFLFFSNITRIIFHLLKRGIYVFACSRNCRKRTILWHMRETTFMAFGDRGNSIW